jgi:hypothetical protein
MDYQKIIDEVYAEVKKKTRQWKSSSIYSRVKKSNAK